MVVIFQMGKGLALTNAAGDAESSFASRWRDNPPAARDEVAIVTPAENRVRRRTDNDERIGDNRIDKRRHSHVKRIDAHAPRLALDRTGLLINNHQAASEQSNGLVRCACYRNALPIDDE